MSKILYANVLDGQKSLLVCVANSMKLCSRSVNGILTYDDRQLERKQRINTTTSVALRASIKRKQLNIAYNDDGKAETDDDDDDDDDEKDPTPRIRPAPEYVYNTSNDLLVDCFMPKTSYDLVGNGRQIATLKKFLTYFKTNLESKHGIIISGPPGIGKTTAANIVSRELGFYVHAFNASDDRGVRFIESKIEPMSRAKDNILSHLYRDSRKLLFLMDEVDGLDGPAVTKLASVIQHATVPFVLIANETYKVKILETVCEKLKFYQLTTDEIVTKLESFGSFVVVRSLCEAAKGDIRQAINAHQFYKKNDDDVTIADKTFANMSEKDISADLFQSYNIITKSRQISFGTKMDIAFQQIDMLPIFAYENVYKFLPDVSRDPYDLKSREVVDCMSRIADSISESNTLFENSSEPDIFTMKKSEIYAAITTLYPILSAGKEKYIPYKDGATLRFPDTVIKLDKRLREIPYIYGNYAIRHINTGNDDITMRTMSYADILSEISLYAKPNIIQYLQKGDIHGAALFCVSCGLTGVHFNSLMEIGYTILKNETDWKKLKIAVDNMSKNEKAHVVSKSSTGTRKKVAPNVKN